MNQSLWDKRIHEPFVLAALFFALTAGFGYAATLAFALALKIPLDAWWLPLVQAHGHAQLFGWFGLFALGMGLYFLPRLVGIKLARIDLAPYAFSCLTAGIFARSVAQPALGFTEASASGWRALWALSAFLELAGIFFIARMMLATRRNLPPAALARDSHAYPLVPFILIAVTSFALAYVANAVGSLGAVVASSATLAPAWDDLVIELMLWGVAAPMAVVFSVRNLPLFLRLAMPPRASLRLLAYGFAAGLGVRILPDVAALLGLNFQAVASLQLDSFIQSIVILIFIWQLDLLRRRQPWVVDRAPNTRPDLDHLRKPTRANYPDAGEYGRFELLIYSAYAWLALTAVMEILRAVMSFTQASVNLPADAIRHALTVGFITMLIFGMAVRMAPGFSGKRRVAYPRLVFVTFVLGNLATLARVVPLFFPASDFSLAFLGSSGALGWLAVACLAVNLVRTFRL